MKIALFASAISVVTGFFLGLVVPLIDFIHFQNKASLNPIVLCIYAGVLFMSLATIMITNLMMVNKAEFIDKLDKKEMELDKQSEELRTLIRKYNNLILEAK